MKKLIILCLIFLWTNSTAQQKDGRLPLPANYRGNIKPTFITDTTAVNIKFTKQVFPKQITPRVKYVEKDHEELEEPIPKDVLEKIKNIEKQKTLIEKRKKLQRLNSVPNENIGEINTTNYPMNEGGAGCPPDNTIGVSRSGHIVAADNSQIGFYREDGTLVSTFSYPDFFNPVQVGLGDNTSDPKVIYDYEANRFVFFIQINSRDSDKSECILAFSKSEDPMDGWNVYVFHHFRDKKPRWFDYPGLAYNETEVFLTGNLLGENKGNVIFQLDKNDGYNGVDMNGLMWLDILEPNNDRKASTIFPMQTIPTWFYEKDMLFASIAFWGGSNFYYYRINNRIDNNPELSKYELNIAEYDWPSNMSQKDTDNKLAGGYIKIRGGFFVDNRIYFVFAKPDKDGFNGIAFVRLKVENFKVKTKFFHDNQNSEYCYPNIAHAGDSKNSHKALLVYLRSGINHYPEVRIRKIKSNMSADGNSTTIQSSDSFCSHCKSNDKVRWGDYIGIQRKGTTNRFWIAGHTANKSNTWKSNLTKIEF